MVARLPRARPLGVAAVGNVKGERVVVCVITYRRPEGLRRLLQALDRQTFAKMDPPPEVEVVVVDNDPGGDPGGDPGNDPGNNPCAGLYRGSRIQNVQLRCFAEPRRGIPHARNRAVEEALKGEARYVAFVDDDEAPEPFWLDELLSVQRERGADAVAGPVLRHFDQPPPSWVLSGGFFVKPRYATGQPVKYVDTANALVRRELLEGRAKPFDERLAFTGGEDTHFFLRAHRDGYTMVWADAAIVRELIPTSRANAGWLLKRAYRLGNSLAFCEVDLYPSASTRAARAAKATARIFRGLLLLLVSPFQGRHAPVKALQDVCRGAGMLAGLTGAVYEEYKKTHGT